jgi:hypothetical protein
VGRDLRGPRGGEGRVVAREDADLRWRRSNGLVHGLDALDLRCFGTGEHGDRNTIRSLARRNGKKLTLSLSTLVKVFFPP